MFLYQRQRRESRTCECARVLRYPHRPPQYADGGVEAAETRPRDALNRESVSEQRGRPATLQSLNDARHDAVGFTAFILRD